MKLHAGKLLLGSALLVGIVINSGRVFAVPILGESIIVSTTGEVTARFEGQTAGFDNELTLFSPANGLGIIFNNHTTAPGTEVSLGTFTAGTELIFQIHVVQTGDNFQTGAGSRNPDGIEHAIVDDAFAPGRTSVGFEDLFGGGDRDFDDTVFSFTNTEGRNPTVPEPATLLLVGAGAGALALKRRLKK